MCVWVCLSVRSYAAHVRHYADILQPLAFTNPRFYTPHQCYQCKVITLPVLLITVLCIWIHSACPFVFCSPSAVFSMSLHASMSAALPSGFWFMNPILVCRYCLQKGALMDQYVESVTRRIASCPQTSWIFFWQPMPCSISDLDDTLEIIY